MKPFTVIVLLAGVALVWIALRPRAPHASEAGVIPRTLEGPRAPGHVVHAFEVTGMCCASCPINLVEALHHVEGIAAIAVDPDRARVEVDTEAGVDDATLSAALTFGDYVARPVD